MIYNATRYTSGPVQGDPIHIIYGATVAKTYNQPGAFIGDDPWDIDWLDFEIYLDAIPQDMPTIFDVEHWPLNDGDQRVMHDSLAMYRACLKFIKTRRPDLPLGMFSAPPSHAQEVTSIAGWWHHEYARWEAKQIAARNLAHHLDWVTPSLYWKTTSASIAAKYATAILSECARFRAWGKKICPFIMPRPIDGGATAPFLWGPGFNDWLNQSVRPYTDGVIVWDYAQHNGEWPIELTAMLA